MLLVVEGWNCNVSAQAKVSLLTSGDILVSRPLSLGHPPIMGEVSEERGLEGRLEGTRASGGGEGEGRFGGGEGRVRLRRRKNRADALNALSPALKASEARL